MAFIQGFVYENACHMCKSQGGLTANVKLHFFENFPGCTVEKKTYVKKLYDIHYMQLLHCKIYKK